MMRLLPFLLLGATPALAKGQMDAIFPSDDSCYLLHYDKAHLAKHQDQSVTEIAIGPYGPEYAAQSRLRVKILVSVRGSNDFFKGYADCQDGGLFLFCAMLDGSGTFSLSPDGAGKVRLELLREGVVFQGETGAFALSNMKEDDLGFVLPPVPADRCP